MIEGLIVTLSGPELKKLCQDRVAHHLKRAKVYAEQIKGMKRNNIEAAAMTGGNPIANLESRMNDHTEEAAEMNFISAHLDMKESYRLERSDLARLGVCKTGRW